MPTETVYGLAANALDETAVRRIFAAKERPGWDPLIVHVSDTVMLQRVVDQVPQRALRLMEAFWPGPLTLLLPRRPDLPRAVTAGRDLVGVRMPAHPVALDLIRTADLPLAAPSANRFGHISPTTAAHVLADLDGRIDAVLDAGPCAIGVESTVLDPEAMVLYRQGGVSKAEIEAVAGTDVAVYQPVERSLQPQSLPSPGVGIRHYAPRARMMLVDGQGELLRVSDGFSMAETGWMLPRGWDAPPSAKYVFAWAAWDDAPGLARTLYDGLRTLDAAGVRTIVCPLPPASDLPLVEAIRDRLQKAARPK